MNLLRSRKYAFLWGCILGFGGYLVVSKSQSIGFSKFQLIGALFISCILFAVIKTFVEFVGFWLIDFYREKVKKIQIKNPK